MLDKQSTLESYSSLFVLFCFLRTRSGKVIQTGFKLEAILLPQLLRQLGLQAYATIPLELRYLDLCLWTTSHGVLALGPAKVTGDLAESVTPSAIWLALSLYFSPLVKWL